MSCRVVRSGRCCVLFCTNRWPPRKEKRRRKRRKLPTQTRCRSREKTRRRWSSSWNSPRRKKRCTNERSNWRSTGWFRRYEKRHWSGLFKMHDTAMLVFLSGWHVPTKSNDAALHSLLSDAAWPWVRTRSQRRREKTLRSRRKCSTGWSAFVRLGWSRSPAWRTNPQRYRVRPPLSKPLCTQSSSIMFDNSSWHYLVASYFCHHDNT